MKKVLFGKVLVSIHELMSENTSAPARYSSILWEGTMIIVARSTIKGDRWRNFSNNEEPKFFRFKWRESIRKREQTGVYIGRFAIAILTTPGMSRKDKKVIKNKLKETLHELDLETSIKQSSSGL